MAAPTPKGEVFFIGTSKIVVNKIIYVQNYLSSGSLFFSSLLDNHRSILSMPGLKSIVLFGSTWFYEQNHFLDKGVDYVFSSILRDFPEIIEQGGQSELGMDALGINADESSGCDKYLFASYFMKLYPAEEYTYDRFIIAVHLAYALARGARVSENMALTFPLHSMNGSIEIFSNTDKYDTRIIHIVRDTPVLYVSTIRHVVREFLISNPPLLAAPSDSVLSQLLFNRSWRGESLCYGDRILSEKFTHRSAAVTLESLKSHHAETMAEVLSWLDLPWDEEVMRSTFDGKLWWNRKGSKRVTVSNHQGKNASNDGIELARRAMMRPAQRLAIEAVTADRRAAWGYTDACPPRWLRLIRLWAPLPYEQAVITLDDPWIVWARKRLTEERGAHLAALTLRTSLRRAKPWLDQLIEEDPELAEVIPALERFNASAATPLGAPSWLDRAAARLLHLAIDMRTYVKMRLRLMSALRGIEQPQPHEIPPLLTRLSKSAPAPTTK